MNKNLFLVFHLVPDNVSLPYERFCVNFSVSMQNSQTKKTKKKLNFVIIFEIKFFKIMKISYVKYTTKIKLGKTKFFLLLFYNLFFLNVFFN